MRHFLSIIFIVLLSNSSLFAQSVFINEYFNMSTSKDDEWVELVTTEALDMRGYKLRDFSGTGSPQNPLIFSQNDLWATIPTGTIIVIKGINVSNAEDTDPSDGVLVISSGNSTYISGNQFNIANTSDAIEILDASDNHIHGISHGSGNASTLPEPKAHYTGTSSSGNSIGFKETKSIADLTSDSKVGVLTATFGQGNDTDNTNLIFSFKEPVDEATLKLEFNGSTLTDGNELDFGSIFVDETKSLRLSVTNLGKATLELSNLAITLGQDFEITVPFTKTQLETFDKSEFEIRFHPTTDGQKEGEFSFSSNDQAAQTIAITLIGNALAIGESTPIADVRGLALGTVVSVSGRVTVANEFGGPIYNQDATAGLSVYYTPLHTAVQIGDSIKVTGPLAEFGTTDTGKGLLQISGDNVNFTKYDVDPIVPEPLVLKINEIQEIHQSVLIKMNNVTFSKTGSFQANTNYDISDGTGTTQIRVDGDVSSIVGAEIPTEPISLIAVVSRYSGSNQLMPRDATDLNVQEIEIPYADVPDSETLDIVTWNLKWFGDAGQDPADDELQVNNVAEVLKTMNADLYAVQEVANATAFQTLLSKLDGYRGFIAPISQSQKTAYIYKPSVIDSLSANFISTNWSSYDSWATGRYPYEFIARVNLNDESRTFFFLNIHAKALSDADSYQRRFNDAQELKQLLDAQRSASNVVLMGDYNDYVSKSTYEGTSVSPYAVFVNDPTNYNVVTKSLEDRGLTSYSRYSMLDHITISNELFDEYLEGTEQIENTVYIGNYLSTTTDHYPVKMRFRWGTPTSIDHEQKSIKAEHIELFQNYPNPFNPSTTISYSIAKPTQVSLTIYSILGEKIFTLIESKFQNSGKHEIQFNAQDLASSVYIYQLKTSDGQILNRMMNLIK